MNITHPMLRTAYGPSGTQHRTTLRLSSTDRSRLQELKGAYRDLFGQKVSDGVVFHRALAVLQDHLRHLTVNHSPQDVAASERWKINKS